MITVKTIADRMVRVFVIITMLSAVSREAKAYDLVVAKDGSGNYTTVQAAINAVPTSLTSAYTIFIKNGKYKEKINIPSNKPFIQLIGESVANTVLTYDDYAGILTGCSSTVGTSNSASIVINASDFSAANITFENAHAYGFPDANGQQAVAVQVNADRSAFKNCRFIGWQDTLYLKGGAPGRAYFKNCYIDGIVDFIFGSSIALFDSCVVYAKTRAGISSSYITAPNTPAGQAYGFVFRDALLPVNRGTTLYYMSRPWPSPSVAGTSQKTVFLSSRLSSHIQPAGWSVWDANTVTANLYYGEYNSRYFNGNTVDVTSRVPWSYQLTQADSATYTFANLFGTWDPCAALPGNCTTTGTDIAISNFKAVKNASSSDFSWNLSWPIAGVNYELYRSTDGVNFSSVYSTTGASDSLINFQYTDPSVPASGNTWYYYIAASKSGYVTHITDTLTISNAASLTVNASAALAYCGFSQSLGTPSVSQTYTVAGSNLTGNVIITPPVNYEVSADNSSWFTNSSSLQITPVSGSVATTTIYVRLNASAVGYYAGNVANITSGVANINVAVTGTTYGPSTSSLLQKWPLTVSASDTAALRSPAVAPTVPTLNKLYTSDGTLPAGTPVPAYSGPYGQAFGSNTAGNKWDAVGGTMKRDYYEQFTVTANAGYGIRIDSITLFSAFYSTASGTKMSAVYSKNGFSSPADSTEFSGGVSANGTSLVLSTSGTFGKSFPLLQNNAGPGAADYYALSLNGNTGVTLNPGETLTIRLYWACSSTGQPRYAMLKNVGIMGNILTGPVPVTLISFNAIRQSNAVHCTWNVSNETNMKTYHVERSTDLRSFTERGVLDAGNNANGSYSFNDMQPVKGMSYYRLRMIDRNNTVTYSNVVRIDVAENTISVFPNPVGNQLYITHPVYTQDQEMTISSADGRILMRSTIGPGTNSTNTDVSALKPGVYTLVIGTGGNSQRFVKL